MVLNGSLNNWSDNLFCKQEVCELGYGTHDCKMDHMTILTRWLQWSCLTPAPLKYCCNSHKFLYNAFEFEKTETTKYVESFSIGIST